MLIIGLTTNLARAAKPMMIGAQLGPLRRSCPRGHMQAIPGLLPDLSHSGHEAMTVQSNYLGGDERRGHAQSSKLHFNASSRRTAMGPSHQRFYC